MFPSGCCDSPSSQVCLQTRPGRFFRILRFLPPSSSSTKQALCSADAMMQLISLCSTVTSQQAPLCRQPPGIKRDMIRFVSDTVVPSLVSMEVSPLNCSLQNRHSDPPVRYDPIMSFSRLISGVDVSCHTYQGLVHWQQKRFKMESGGKIGHRRTQSQSRPGFLILIIDGL